ncbi:RPM1-interacting protein 4 [Abeliophyllum distichum]|uniref:RPM1-interacting protein 4 n=1 Tax=Abeliophyllum distichum TaxID=126358 RepID=A0ABD1PUQ1_9LAMI
MAQQRSHVPKFGNWDGDNVPYTVYFEKARKEKTGGLMINPNDPEENPDAFNFGGLQHGNSSHSRAASASIPISPDKPVAAENFQQYGRQRNASGQKKSSSSKTVASESGSDKSTSDHSLLKPKHLRRRSERNKSLTDSSIPPSAGPNRMNHPDDFSYRSASVPKFGEWDEKDPHSGDGFTVIFNKVKEEKQLAAAKFPPAPLQTANTYPTSPNMNTRSKKCCCLF